MRRAGAGFVVAALLALAGCKSTDTKDDKGPLGFGAARPKPKEKDKDKEAKDAKPQPKSAEWWLDGVDKLPGAGTAVPKSTTSTNPKDSNFDPKVASQELLAGRVLDPFGRPARKVFVRVQYLGRPDPEVRYGNYTGDDGYFQIDGLERGASCDVSVSVKAQDGRTYAASVQTKVPNVTLALVLRDDLPPQPGTFAPPAPSGDGLPPGGFVPPTPKPSTGDGWSPGGPATAVPPPTVGPKPAPKGGLPPPEGLIPDSAPSAGPPARPENVADNPKGFKPPVTSIPGPGAVPPPPPLPKTPDFGPGGSSRAPAGSGVSRTAGKFTLLDAAERPWSSDLIRSGELVVVEFITSTCVPCKRAIPVLKDVQARYGASGLQVKAVLCDEGTVKERLAVADRYAREQGLNYALYVEPGAAGSVRDTFDVEQYPHAVLIDSNGRVLWRGNPLTDGAKLDAAVRQNLAK